MLEIVGEFVPSVFLQWCCDQLTLVLREGESYARRGSSYGKGSSLSKRLGCC
jgi:hypothetical protein